MKFGRSIWIKTIFGLFLLVGLPLFIWAVLTQRIELRKRAEPNAPIPCWNNVATLSGILNWPNGCKGNISTDSACTTVMVPLTSDEITEYQTWLASGSATIPGCEQPTTPIPTITGTPIPTPITQPITFKVKLAGVNTGDAVNAGDTLTAKFFLKNGTVILLSDPLPLTYVGSGVYGAAGRLTDPFTPGTEFAVQVKVNKHLAVRFCQQTGQTEPCDYSTWMTVNDYNFDFTGRPLPAGDLNNNGRVDAADLKILTDFWDKPPSQLTTDELKSADVNYNGSLEQMDLNEILKTLSVRYNE